MMTSLDIEYGPGGRADLRLPGGTLSIRGISGPTPGETDGVVFLSQVHGSLILQDPSGGEEADGLVVSGGRLSPGLRVADCLPVFILGSGYRAAFHAGWRGLASGIAGRMIGMLPAAPDWVLLGPCICGDCYEVGPDVRRAVLKGLPEEGHPPGRLDLARAAIDGMLDAGLAPCTRIFRVRECTRCRGDLFHSHRADGTRARNLVWLTDTGARGEVALDSGACNIPLPGDPCTHNGYSCCTYNCLLSPIRRDQ